MSSEVFYVRLVWRDGESTMFRNTVPMTWIDAQMTYEHAVKSDGYDMVMFCVKGNLVNLEVISLREWIKMTS